MGLEEFAEERGVGEVEIVGHPLHAHISVFEVVFYAADSMSIYNLRRSLSCNLLHTVTKMVRTVA